MNMEGYKVFKPDWTCRGFQYQVGETYEENVIPICCDRGFHFCKDLKDCFSYYDFNPNNKVAKVIALGDIDHSSEDSKCCTNKIQIVEEITWEEVLRLVNVGKGCSGFCNSGDCNSGDWNKCNYSNGCFNTKEPKIYLFNKPSDWTYRDWIDSNARYLLNKIPTDVLDWVFSKNMTDQEKQEHPEHETTGGFLKMIEKSESNQAWWDSLSEYQKNIIKDIPNFDPDVFEEITGIRV